MYRYNKTKPTTHRQKHQKRNVGMVLHPKTHSHVLDTNEIAVGFTSDDFKARRANVLNRLGENSVLILPSRTEAWMSHNVAYPFRQDSDFYYYTGCYDPDSCAVIGIGLDCIDDKIMLMVS